jgi:hypothetical protein
LGGPTQEAAKEIAAGMKAILSAHLILASLLAGMWALGHQMGVYWLWAIVQGPFATFTLVSLLGLSSARQRAFRFALSALLLTCAWFASLAFAFFSPSSDQLVPLWAPSPWDSLILLPVLAGTISVSSLLSTLAVRIVLAKAVRPYFRIVPWNCLAAALIIASHNTGWVWLGLPVALAWHAGLVAALLSANSVEPAGVQVGSRVRES